jgi:hypothetical protein
LFAQFQVVTPHCPPGSHVILPAGVTARAFGAEVVQWDFSHWAALFSQLDSFSSLLKDATIQVMGVMGMIGLMGMVIRRRRPGSADADDFDA